MVLGKAIRGSHAFGFYGQSKISNRTAIINSGREMKDAVT